MVFIVPDTILEKRTCSQCDKYLSVKPVKVYANGATKCGRCAKDHDGGVVSFYRTLVKDGLFHCVNRYDGCKQIMTSSEVTQHEKLCLVEEGYRCPFCDNNFSSYFMFRHVKREHPDRILKRETSITLDLQDNLNNIYVCYKNFVVFIIFIDVFVDIKSLHIRVTCLRQKELNATFDGTIFWSERPGCTYNFSGFVTSYSKPNKSKPVTLPFKHGLANISVKLNLDIPQEVVDISPLVEPLSTTFRYVIPNFTDVVIKGTGLTSPEYYICGLSVYLSVNLNQTKEKSFSIFLHIDKSKTIQKSWVCDADVEFTLVAAKPNVNNYSRKLNHRFVKGYGRGYRNFKSVFDVLSPSYGYIKDDEITIETTVKVNSFKIDE